MLSRYQQIQEKRQTRRAVILVILSIVFFASFIIFGIPNLATLATVFRGLKEKESVINEVDKTPPGPPQMIALPRYVKTDTVTITGNAEIPSTLKVYRNEEVVKTVQIEKTTKYSTTITLVPGKNEVWTTATDPAGNEGVASPINRVIYDIEPPVIELIQPQDKEAFFGENKTVEIKGKTEPEARVTVNGRIANVDLEGNFSIRYILNSGDNILVIESSDPADNKSEKTITVVYSP